MRGRQWPKNATDGEGRVTGIYIEPPKDAKGKGAKVIYKFEGDKLVLCSGRGERPTEFRSDPIKKTTVMLFKRVTPK